MVLSKSIKNLVVGHIQEFLEFASENGEDKAVLEELYKKFSESLEQKSPKKPKKPKKSQPKDEKLLCQVLLKSGPRKNHPCGKNRSAGEETCSKHKSSAKKKLSREQEEFDDNELTEGFFKSEEIEEAEEAEAERQSQFQKNEFREEMLEEELSESDDE